MDMERAYRVLKEVAKRNGTTVEEVAWEIELGINEAIETATKEKNIVAINEWEKIPCVGNRPNAFELVAYLGEKVLKNSKRENNLAEDFSGLIICS